MVVSAAKSKSLRTHALREEEMEALNLIRLSLSPFLTGKKKFLQEIPLSKSPLPYLLPELSPMPLPKAHLPLEMALLGSSWTNHSGFFGNKGCGNNSGVP